MERVWLLPIWLPLKDAQTFYFPHSWHRDTAHSKAHFRQFENRVPRISPHPGPYLHDLSDLTLILQPFQFQVCCANQLVTSKKGSGKARHSRGLAWTERAGMNWPSSVQANSGMGNNGNRSAIPPFLPCQWDWQKEFLPFVKDLKFDSFALDHPLKATVISIDV